MNAEQSGMINLTEYTSPSGTRAEKVISPDVAKKLSKLSSETLFDSIVNAQTQIEEHNLRLRQIQTELKAGDKSNAKEAEQLFAKIQDLEDAIATYETYRNHKLAEAREQRSKDDYTN